MANKVFKRAALNVYFQTGLDEQEKPILKRLTLQHVAANTTSEALTAVAQAIASLYDGVLAEVEVVSNETIA